MKTKIVTGEGRLELQKKVSKMKKRGWNSLSGEFNGQEASVPTMFTQHFHWFRIMYKKEKAK